jgi:hypothetical protein
MREFQFFESIIEKNSYRSFFVFEIQMIEFNF